MTTPILIELRRNGNCVGNSAPKPPASPITVSAERG
jgi:hypothetical protein